MFEIKLVIHPSNEMIELVNKLVGGFVATPTVQNAGVVYAEKAAVAPVEIIVTETVEAPKRTRRTKAEIEAENAPATEVETTPVEVEVEVEVETAPAPEGFIPDVVLLRKMTVDRSNVIDIPAELAKLGYNSVTKIAADPEAAQKYYNFLLTIKI